MAEIRAARQAVAAGLTPPAPGRLGGSAVLPAYANRPGRGPPARQLVIERLDLSRRELVSPIPSCDEELSIQSFIR
ncbi:hypothetical protein ABZY81_27095 [Streptomyces sp. NPDC006514]|uniref:hypothetical protein n=1 Tax=Streptomyces sp. NPDC006514 TaxID=3154308 RepID=UPI0033B0F033